MKPEIWSLRLIQAALAHKATPSTHSYLSFRRTGWHTDNRPTRLKPVAPADE